VQSKGSLAGSSSPDEVSRLEMTASERMDSEEEITLSPRSGNKFYIISFSMEMEKAIKIRELSKQAAKIKVSKKLMSMEDAPFFKKKMAKGERMPAAAGLPKK
jgi:predicted RNA-binding Zn ribbon-like protein